VVAALPPFFSSPMCRFVVINLRVNVTVNITRK
jgi:hypothetical protein